MPVLLRRSGDLPEAGAYRTWCVVEGTVPPLPPARRLPEEGGRLERAFDAVADTWLAIARDLGGEPSARLAHAPAAAANVSDFGLMLAWAAVVGKLAAAREPTLAICDDPWLFRHLSRVPGVEPGPPPRLWPVRLRLAIRGWLARLKCALTVYAAGLALRSDRTRAAKGSSVLLVYGHPHSTANGDDAYFGPLMKEIPDLTRVLHVDCPVARARRLGGGRTTSLHAWGSLAGALALPFARWRPSGSRLSGPHGWLVRCAAAREGGTAQGAMIRWQIICQKNWLERVRPDVVAWPWENHAWERAFVRDARALGVKTVGYQHSVIGPQMLNYAPASNPDGLASIPDRILCAGRATRDQLARWGIPDDRLAVAGALRFTKAARPTYDKSAPVFMALPSNSDVAGEMVMAAIRAGRAGWRFVVKPHPMMPFSFTENDIVRSTDRPLSGQEKVSAVVYAGTTVGLEAMVAGIPTLRFQPRNTIALNILPRGVAVPTADSASLADVLERLAKPPQVDRHFFFAPVDLDLWRDHLFAD